MSNLETPDKFHCLFVSLEMKPEILLSKLLSTYIFDQFGIEISYKKMFSKTRNEILSDEDYEVIKQCIPWMQKVEQMLTIYDKSLNAPAFFKLLKDLADKNGRFEEDENRKYYIPNDPDKVILVVTDHLALVTPIAGNSLKNEMDNVSKVAVQFRNRCKFSFLMIMQANRESANIERRKMELMSPQRSDLKDSSCMEADSDIIIAIFNPFREKLKKYRGYDITLLNKYYREISILKSRYGDGDVAFSCTYFGGCNKWFQLPKAEDIYDYGPLIDLNFYKKELNNNLKIEEDENKETVDNEKDQDTKQPFEFIL